MKDELKAYRSRWAEVAAVIAVERCTASLELRWRQLNTVCALAIGLELCQEDTSEAGVFERWAMLKDKAADQLPKV